MTVNALLADFEAVMDAPADSGTPAPEPEDGPAPLEAPAEAAPPEPAAPSWRDDPAFLEAVDERAAEIARAQIAQHQPAPTAVPSAEPDLNEMLSPFNDDFGTNLAKFIRDENARATAPLTERFQTEDATKADAAVAEMIDEAVTQAGGFPDEVADDAKALVKLIAPSYGKEMVDRYGESDRAAEAILQKATQTVQNLISKAGKTGGQQRVDELAAVAGADTTLTGGGAAVNTPPPAASLEELYRTRFGSPL